MDIETRITEDEESMLIEKSYEYVWTDIDKIIQNLYNIDPYGDDFRNLLWTILRNGIFIDFKIDSDLTSGMKWCIYESICSQIIILKNVGIDCKPEFKRIIGYGIDTIGEHLDSSLHTDYINNDVFPKFKAAYIIQKQWRESISNPSYKVCRDRLQREFGEMATELKM